MKKFLLILLLATSCSRTYIPNTRNSPMFTEKGEIQLNFQVGNGLNAQGAVAFSENFGVIGSYSYLERSSGEKNSASDYRKYSFGEGGVGYFKNNKKTFFEIFAGYGEGTGYSDERINFPGISGFSGFSFAGAYKRYFFQPAFGFNKSVMFVSFVPRFSLVDFTKFSTGGVLYKVDEHPTLFFEPAVIGRGNFHDYFYITFQGGLAVPVSHEPYFSHRTLQISMGLGFRFGGKKTEEKSSE